MSGRAPRLSDRLENGAFRAFLALALALPYRWRVPAAGWAMAHLVAPVAGYRRRVRENLALVRPDLPPAEVARLARQVPDNVGRTMIELYSGDEFIARMRDVRVEGPGAAALEAAQAAGRPVILATGHFGNYDAGRAALLSRGHPVGALYRPMKNPLFNAHYVAAMSRIGTPLFPRDRRGMAEMLRHLRDGGMVGIVHDQHMDHGAALRFFGQRADTATSAADMALRYDALLLPMYAIRQANGLDFRIHADPPVEHGAPEAMMQALNDSLERMVRAHMDQWFWIHRRWKAALRGRAG